MNCPLLSLCWSPLAGEDTVFSDRYLNDRRESKSDVFYNHTKTPQIPKLTLNRFCLGCTMIGRDMMVPQLTIHCRAQTHSRSMTHNSNRGKDVSKICEKMADIRVDTHLHMHTHRQWTPLELYYNSFNHFWWVRSIDPFCLRSHNQ